MAERKKVFVTRKLPGTALDRLRKDFDVEVNEFDRVLTREEVMRGLQGKDALLCLLTDKIDAEIMDSNKNLKMIANYAVGFDNIDVQAATRRKVAVSNTPGVLTQAVAEHTFALLMAIARRIAESDRFARAGKYHGWEPEMLIGTELKGKTIGIFGLGRIGTTVAQMAVKGMGMKVRYSDVYTNAEFEKEYGAKRVDKDTLLKEADFVSLHVNLTPETHHFIGEKELLMMKPTSYLINTSRGPVVDENALVRALKGRWIKGAAIDVFEFEPNLAEGLAELDNVVLTPHTASATWEARTAMADLAVDNIFDFFAGKIPRTIVNKEVFLSNAKEGSERE